MALTAEEVFIAGTGHVYIADVGTAAPADTIAAWGAGWTELGYTEDNGVAITPGKNITDIPAWQSRFPIRRIVTAETLTAAFSLLQWNATTVALAFGGGSWAGDVFTPPAAGSVDERALGVEAVDGDKITRLIIPRGMVSAVGAINLVKTGGNPIPITFALLGVEGEEPYTIIANWVDES